MQKQIGDRKLLQPKAIDRDGNEGHKIRQAVETSDQSIRYMIAESFHQDIDGKEDKNHISPGTEQRSEQRPGLMQPGGKRLQGSARETDGALQRNNQSQRGLSREELLQAFPGGR